MTMSMWIEALKTATPEELAEIRSLIGSEEKAAKASKAKSVKMPAVALPPLPEGVPTAADYRVAASAINDSVCVARAFSDKDTRFRPFVLRESQCGAAQVDGSDLCKKCTRRAAKYADKPEAGDWSGRITEEPLDWVHMLGTTWALEKKPKFTPGPTGQASTELAASAAAKFTAGPQALPSTTADAPASAKFTAGAGASASASVAAPAPEVFASSSSAPAPAPAPVIVTAPAPVIVTAPAPVIVTAAAAPAAKAAEKEAAKAAAAAAKAAAKLAEKEAAAAAKAAEKEAAKVAKEAAKAAEKEAAKAAKAAAKKGGAAAAGSVTEAKVAASAAAAAVPVDVTGKLELIDGTLYMIKNGNVYEYDELTEKAGDFVGRITAEKTIDTDGVEVGAAESETD